MQLFINKHFLKLIIMPLGNAFILSLTQVAPIGYINVFDFEPAIIAVYLQRQKYCCDHYCPRKVPAIPSHGDHFDCPCCGIWNRTWHCTLPFSVGISDMGVSAGPALCCLSHVAWLRIWLQMCHGHGEHTLPMDLLPSESTGLLCLLHFLLPVFWSVLRVP